MTEPFIHVCPLDLVSETVRRQDAGHVVSLINRDMMPSTPDGIAEEQHLKLAMNDIVSPTSGLTAPSGDHVRELIEFVDNWPRSRGMVIHCWAGISRSTAAALITLCQLNPDHSEQDIALLIRQRSPTASPNRLMIETADDLLLRGGRLFDAWEAMGQAEIASRGVPFSIRADLDNQPVDSVCR